MMRDGLATSSAILLQAFSRYMNKTEKHILKSTLTMYMQISLKFMARWSRILRYFNQNYTVEALEHPKLNMSFPALTLTEKRQMSSPLHTFCSRSSPAKVSYLIAKSKNNLKSMIFSYWNRTSKHSGNPNSLLQARSSQNSLLVCLTKILQRGGTSKKSSIVHG